MAGGNGGSQPRLSVRLMEHVPTDGEAMTAVDRVVAWFRAQNRRCRLGKIIGELGIERVREEIFGGAECP
jgi:NAD(P)H-nitrite reductase large subunit